MAIGPFQILVVLLVVLVLFGRGRISEMMGDVGKGVKSFRKGLSEDEVALQSTRSETGKPVADARSSSSAD